MLCILVCGWLLQFISPPHLTSLSPAICAASEQQPSPLQPPITITTTPRRRHPPTCPTTFDNLFLYSFARSPHSFLYFCRLGIAASISVHRQRLAQASSTLISEFTVLLFTSRAVSSSYLIRFLLVGACIKGLSASMMYFGTKL